MPQPQPRPLTMLDPVAEALRQLHGELTPVLDGTLPDYIPELSRADPNLFGMAVATPDGQVRTAGDATTLFTIQSISKPFVYALALADWGMEALLERVGAEPSGEAFNAISLEEGTGRPDNPMVNAGAIVTTSLVEATDVAHRFERIRSLLSRFAGRELELDEHVFASEWRSADKNRALAYLMRNAGSLTAEVDDALEVYFKQCSLLVNTTDLAVMSVTLAANGINPITGDAVVTPDVARHVLTMMATCGLYDYSGEWMLRVGMPAKSGVSGGLIAASPGQFGVGLFSPRLDERGNSVRAAQACQLLSDRYELHALGHPDESEPVVRPAAEVDRAMAVAGTALPEPDTAVVTAQGDLMFASTQTLLQHLLRLVERRGGDLRVLVLNLDRVTRLHRVGWGILTPVLRQLADNGVAIVLVDGACRALLDSVAEFATLPEALAWRPAAGAN
ncbi:MAG: glutaminase A [Cryobacterium sp.]